MITTTNLRHPASKFSGFYMPKSILLLNGLNASEKMVLAYICSFAKEDKIFFASNRNLQMIINVSQSTVSKIIGKLIKRGYIVRLGWDGRIRELSASEAMLERLTSKQKGTGTSNEKHVGRLPIKKGAPRRRR